MTGVTAAVVLNYRTPEDSILAVRALQASAVPLDPIVLVDNGSGDDSLERLRRGVTGVELIALQRNEGFAGGCNAGIRMALESGADSTLLVNSDAILPPDGVAALRQVLSTEARTGIVSPALRRRSDPDVVESLGISYHVTSGRMRLIAHGSRPDDVLPFDRHTVDAVSGAVMLIRREVFETVGLLREEYFFGFEDVDFCCRARAHGWESVCAGSISALHGGSGSMGRRAPARAYFATRNHLLVASRFPADGGRTGRLLRLANVLALNAGHAILATDIPTAGGLAAVVRGACDFARGRFRDGHAGGG